MQDAATVSLLACCETRERELWWVFLQSPREGQHLTSYESVHESARDLLDEYGNQDRRLDVGPLLDHCAIARKDVLQ